MGKRTRFAVVGLHPLLDLVKRHFIEVKKFECVGFDAEEAPDFLLAGGMSLPMFSVFPIPAFVLATDDMYTIRDLDGSAREKAPMAEDAYTVISPLSYDSTAVARAIQNENMWLLRESPTMLLRIFNVYGPSITDDVVHKFLTAAKDRTTLTVHSPGFQTRTFLWEEDFLECVGKLVDKFLEGTTGIFNVGSDEEVSIRRLADSCWQQYQSWETEIIEVKSKYPHRFWKLPDITRTKAVADWKPTVSLRKGLWRLANTQ